MKVSLQTIHGERVVELPPGTMAVRIEIGASRYDLSESDGELNVTHYGSNFASRLTVVMQAANAFYIRPYEPTNDA